MNNGLILPKRTLSRPFNNRIGSRFGVFKDKYFNSKTLFRLTLPLIVVLIALPFALVLLVNITYQRRIIKSSDDISTEIRSMVIVLKYTDFINSSSDTQAVFNEAVSLYNDKKIDSVYIFPLSDKNIPSADAVLPDFKGIPSDKLTIDVLSKDETDVCKRSKDNYKLSKFIVMSYKDYLSRINYVCNSMDLYSKAYFPDGLNISLNDNVFINTLSDIIRINFGGN